MNEPRLDLRRKKSTCRPSSLLMHFIDHEVTRKSPNLKYRSAHPQGLVSGTKRNVLGTCGDDKPLSVYSWEPSSRKVVSTKWTLVRLCCSGDRLQERYAMQHWKLGPFCPWFIKCEFKQAEFHCSAHHVAGTKSCNNQFSLKTGMSLKHVSWCMPTKERNIKTHKKQTEKHSEFVLQWVTHDWKWRLKTQKTLLENGTCTC